MDRIRFCGARADTRVRDAALRLGIQMHVAGLSLSNTISILERLGVEHDDVPGEHAWTTLIALQGKRLVKKTYDSNSSTQYRLTENGCDTVDAEEPDVPVVAEDE